MGSEAFLVVDTKHPRAALFCIDYLRATVKLIDQGKERGEARYRVRVIALLGEQTGILEHLGEAFEPFPRPGRHVHVVL